MQALSPIPGLMFIHARGTMGFIVLGSVFLAVTGAEALYADMGHFGRRPIQAAWLFIVLPALICNYLGQGALILNDPKAVANPFYLLAPGWGLVPLILLSTAATVIASQAVITGAYSLASQAIQLGLLPRLEIVHTSSTQEGQIFIPRVNRVLLFGVLGLVLLFRSSDALANAYGIAVSGTMVATTSLAFFVVWKLWRWPLWAALALTGAFLSIDVAFFIANLYKVVDGGWVPLTHRRRDVRPDVDLVARQRNPAGSDASGRDPDAGPDQDAREVEAGQGSGNGGFPHQRSDLGAVVADAQSQAQQGAARARRPFERAHRDDPARAAANRYEMTSLSPDFMLVTLHFGYMEQPHIPRALAAMRKAGLKFDIMTTSFFLGRRTLKTAPNSGMPLWQDKLFIAMTKQAASAPDFFNLPSDRVVELGAQMKV